MKNLCVAAVAVMAIVLSGREVSAAPVRGGPSAKECVERGIAIQKKGDERAVMREALPLFDRAIVLDPKLSEAYLRAGAIRLSLALKSNSRKRLESAISLLSRCAALEPKQARCHVMVGNAYGFKGDRAASRKSYQQACDLGEKSWCEAARSGKQQPSIEEFHKALSKEKRLDPKDVADIP